MKIKIGRFRWNSRIEYRRMAILLGVAFIALVAGITVFVGLVRLPTLTPRVSPSDPGALVITRAGDSERNRILDEEAQLFDPAPLFLPTPHNYTQADPVSISHREPVQTFQPFPPGYTYSDDTFDIRFPDPVSVPAQPAGMLDYKQTQTPYATLGRVEHPAAPLPPRQACLEVIRVKTGELLLQLPIAPLDPSPPNIPEALVTGDWSPLEFLAMIDITGLAAPPTLMKGAGTPAVVQYLSDYLDKTLHIDARRELTPGLYILRVCP
ncbi:MAG: hypothetical protein LBM04_04925 [Opitutaceae bacterium]|jgi:hypothetical protein|nr:hypothetical protein [Opitutaceae bacterium]